MNLTCYLPFDEQLWELQSVRQHHSEILLTWNIISKIEIERDYLNTNYLVHMLGRERGGSDPFHVLTKIITIG